MLHTVIPLWQVFGGAFLPLDADEIPPAGVWTAPGHSESAPGAAFGGADAQGCGSRGNVSGADRPLSTNPRDYLSGPGGPALQAPHRDAVPNGPLSAARGGPIPQQGLLSTNPRDFLGVPGSRTARDDAVSGGMYSDSSARDGMASGEQRRGSSIRDGITSGGRRRPSARGSILSADPGSHAADARTPVSGGPEGSPLDTAR